MNTSFEFNLSQAEKLELASIGTREPVQAITPPPYAYAPLRDKIKARDMNPRLSASRFTDEDLGECDASLAIMAKMKSHQNATMRRTSCHPLAIVEACMPN